jgi:hypothetical protein
VMPGARAVLLSLALLGGAAMLRGQRPAGEIRLEVRDPSGAAMEASGSIHNLASGTGRSIRTDAQGNCTLKSVPYGRYRLELWRSGFATQFLLTEVQSDTPVSRTITMALGPAADSLEVVATTPLPGVGLSITDIPAPVQTATAGDIELSGALNLADFLNRRPEGVIVNEIQGNPFQPDVNYRGYTASPLLGTPQGLSVYMDGVRFNQPFGDVVSSHPGTELLTSGPIIRFTAGSSCLPRSTICSIIITTPGRNSDRPGLRIKARSSPAHFRLWTGPSRSCTRPSMPRRRRLVRGAA